MSKLVADCGIPRNKPEQTRETRAASLMSKFTTQFSLGMPKPVSSGAHGLPPRSCVAAVVQLKQSSLRNRLLRALAPEEFALVGPHLEQVALPRGKVLIQPYQPIENVIFPESGVASAVALSSDNRPV